MYPCQEEMVDNLLSSKDSVCGGLSLAKALLPLVDTTSSSMTPWGCSTRYKTELCSHYNGVGYCKYAERCQFAHGLHELHIPSRHPRYKTELCRTYHTTGYCIYDSRCLFVHSPNEQRPPGRRQKNIPCRTYGSFGVCPFGTRCNFLHTEGGGSGSGLETPDSAIENVPTSLRPPRSQEWHPRGALCRTFSSFGFCLYGVRCRFQHGIPSTSKSPEQNQHQGSSSSIPPQLNVRSLSPGSDMFSSDSSSSPSALASPVYPDNYSPSTTPFNEPVAHNAFTFSSQHLNDLLLPLALRLKQLENNQAMASATNSKDPWNRVE
ncbi:cysteine three histidine 1 [Aplochiton taeniatus]